MDLFHVRGFNLPAQCPPRHPCHSRLTGWGPAHVNPLQNKFGGIDFLVPSDPCPEGVQEGATPFLCLKVRLLKAGVQGGEPVAGLPSLPPDPLRSFPGESRPLTSPHGVTAPSPHPNLIQRLSG